MLWGHYDERHTALFPLMMRENGPCSLFSLIMNSQEAWEISAKDRLLTWTTRCPWDILELLLLVSWLQNELRNSFLGGWGNTQLCPGITPDSTQELFLVVFKGPYWVPGIESGSSLIRCTVSLAPSSENSWGVPDPAWLIICLRISASVFSYQMPESAPFPSDVL